jgi:hypothetical protein
MLYDITATEAINGIVETVKEVHPELTKAEAKKYVINALVYYCVIDEVIGQVDFLLEQGGE